MKKFLTAAMTGMLMLACLCAQAQTQRVRGDVVSLDGNLLTVKTREGTEAKLQLTEKTTVGYLTRIQLSDIKPGDFVGSAAVIDKDGKLVAREVLLFPESMRGTGEGHYPWDLEAGSTMTNANVAKMVRSVNGQTLTLEYKGGSREILVPEGVPVVKPAVGDRALLVPGTYVFAVAQPAADGTLTAMRIYATKEGVRPPM